MSSREISLFRSLLDTAPERVALPGGQASQLVRILPRTRLPKGPDCPGWSPAVFRGARARANVESVHALGIDFDQGEPPWERFDGLDYFAHETHSSTPEAPRWRVVLTLAEPLTLETWGDHVFEALGLTDESWRAAKDPSRFFYLPPEGCAVRIGEGAPYAPPPPPPPAPAPAIDARWSLPGELSNQAGRVLSYCRSKAEHDRSIQGQNGSAALARWAGAIFWKLGLSEAEGWPLLLEMNQIGASPPWSERELRHAMANGLKPHPGRPGPRGHLLREWQAADQERERERELQRKNRMKREASVQHMAVAGDDFGPLEYPELAATELGGEQEASEQKGADDWRALLSMTAGSKAAPPMPKRCLENVLTTLKHCPEWAGVLRYNEFTDRIEVCAPMPRAAHHEGPGEVGTWRDGLSLWAIAWFHERLGFEPSDDMMAKAVAEAARSNAYHPVRDWLRGLRWDRKPRCDRMLATLFGAEDSEVNRAIGSKWMISAVARVMRPGCQVDHMMVLEGVQGSRKSTALRVLVGEEWFRNSPIDLRNKDAAMALRGCWVYEFDELDAFRGRDATRVKSFITLRVDSYRPAYGRAIVDIPRECAFVGSTNEDRYLADPTGNRRFWPVRCGVIDIPGLTEARDQLWAEAYARYCAGELWHVESAGLVEQFKAAQAEREEVDPWLEAIESWWTGLHEGRREKGITTCDIASSVLDLKMGQVERRDEMRIGNCLRKLGFVRRRVKHQGSLSWRYFQDTGAGAGGAAA